MKTIRAFVAAALCALMPFPPALAQQIAQNSEIVVVPAGDTLLRWFAHEGRTYFIQSSDPNAPLERWIWTPFIESGNDEEISHETGSTADMAFFRLHYTDEPPPPGVSLEDWDADGDGLSNALELSLQGNPLSPDTSGDGIPDGWAHAHGLSLNANHASSLFPDSGLTYLEVYNLGVQAHPDATPDDFDGDGVPNDDDAGPWDNLIDWKAPGVDRFVVIEMPAQLLGAAGQTDPRVIGIDAEANVLLATQNISSNAQGGGFWRVGANAFDPATAVSVTYNDPVWGNLTRSSAGLRGMAGDALIHYANAPVDYNFGGTLVAVPGEAAYGFWPAFRAINGIAYDAWPLGGDIRGTTYCYADNDGANGAYGFPSALYLLNRPTGGDPTVTQAATFSDFGNAGQHSLLAVSRQGWVAFYDKILHPSDSVTLVSPGTSMNGGWLQDLPERSKASAFVALRAAPPAAGILVPDDNSAWQSPKTFEGQQVVAAMPNGAFINSHHELWTRDRRDKRTDSTEVNWLPPRDWAGDTFADLIGDGWEPRYVPGASDPSGAFAIHLEKSGETSRVLLLVPVQIKLRIPVIPDDSGATTYEYVAVAAAPWDRPTPGVEIIGKNISGDQLLLSAKIYDALSDAGEGLEAITPRLWVNDREINPAPGDRIGVYRLTNYEYKLFPGRNVVTVSVRNALGVGAHHSVVIEGQDQDGYTMVEEPAKVPDHPTYPTVCELYGLDLAGNQEIKLTIEDKSLEVGTEQDGTTFRTNPFLSLDQPETATSGQIANLPEDKPLFPAELDSNIEFEILLQGYSSPIGWSASQFGMELLAPKRVAIRESDEASQTIQIRARGLGRSPGVKAVLTTYRNDGSQTELTSIFSASYQQAYDALSEEERDDPVSFTVEGVSLEEGYSMLELEFSNSHYVKHLDAHHSFRYSSPLHAGVRVFSANRIKDAVIDGVTGRMGEIWYPVSPEADLDEIGEALAASGCQIVGMTELSGCFENWPLKRSFLVRGPPGRPFKGFDELYTLLGREQRSQTFEAVGTHGTALAGELARIQDDESLPASARNALGLEVAETYQFHNGFEDLVPKVHQPFIDPGTGIPQPNSWTMRGTSLPDDPDSNPTPWTVTNTLGDPARAYCVDGILTLDTTNEDTAYYAATSPTAPWDLDGPRSVSLRFRLLEHDEVNGSDGAFQLSVGDGSRTWTCQVASSEIKIQGAAFPLPQSVFPGGLIDGNFHTLQISLSGIGNDSIVSIDGELLTATATADTGTLNGIAFGDPGSGISGKIEVDTLGFENSELRYQYGYFADDYADSDEIARVNNLLLYIRSKGQAFRTSPIARWVRILDPNVHEWLLEKYTTKRNDGAEQELHIISNKDIWFGSTVSMKVSTDYGSTFNLWDSKVTNTLVLDKEETKIWSTDRTRTEMELAGLLMSWCYGQHAYKVWLAEKEGDHTGIDGILIEKKHLIENIAKCAQRVETTLALGGEIAISITNEYADYAITLNYIRQGDYMAMVGFIPLVPSSTAKALRFLNKADGAPIEAIHQLSTKLNDFPSGKHEFPNSNLPGNKRILDFDKIFANADEVEAVTRARQLTSNNTIPNSGWHGRELLETFANSNVTVFRTKEPLKAYRCFSSNPNISEFGPSGGFLMFERPINRTQVEIDYALGKNTEGFFLKNSDGTSAYDRFVEIDIPEGSYVYMGFAADQGGPFKGGGTQIWVDNLVRDDINWNVPWSNLPQY